MTRKIAIGIDFGTTTSGIAYLAEGGTRPRVLPFGTGRTMLPSVVGTNLHDELVIGFDATAFKYVKADARVSRIEVPYGESIREVKRAMGSSVEISLGGQIHKPQEIAAILLRHLRRWAEQSLAAEHNEAVLSVPANFPDAARSATQQAARLAGFEAVRLISEPTAAALAFGIGQADLDEQILVFDFGGGTLDITVLEMMEGVLDVQASFGDSLLGGSDLDAAMGSLLMSEFQRENPGVEVAPDNMKLLVPAAEQAKIALSDTTCHRVVIRNFGRRGGEPIDLSLDISRDAFESAAASVLSRVRNCLRAALKTKGFRPSSIQRVLLVGGSTHVPAVRRVVAETFGLEPRSDVNPDTAVCEGAAVHAAIVFGLLDPATAPILADVAPFGLGVRVVGIVGSQIMEDLYSPLMAPNTTIPHTATHEFSLLHPEQNAIEIEVFQDHFGRAQRVSDAVDTGLRGKIEDIPPALSGLPRQVRVDFSYDVDGLIRIDARVDGVEGSVTIAMDKSAMRLSEVEEAEAQARVDDAWKNAAGYSQVEPILNRASEMLALLDPDDAAKVVDACDRLKAALANGSGDYSSALNELTDLLFDMEDLAYG